MKKKTYTVNVGNIGNMEYSSKKLALECYATYVTLSMNNEGRAAGESVALFAGDTIIKEYPGTIDDEPNGYDDDGTIDLG